MQSFALGSFASFDQHRSRSREFASDRRLALQCTRNVRRRANDACNTGRL